jgi:long-chain acyl-CoA synthetase
VVLARGVATPRMQDLIQFARLRVGYKAPEEIIVLDEMPLNATGKIDRIALKRIEADAGAVPVRPRRIARRGRV